MSTTRSIHVASLFVALAIATVAGTAAADGPVAYPEAVPTYVYPSQAASPAYQAPVQVPAYVPTYAPPVVQPTYAPPAGAQAYVPAQAYGAQTAPTVVVIPGGYTQLNTIVIYGASAVVIVIVPVYYGYAR